MPGSYLIDQTREIVFSRAWGVLTDDEVIWHAKSLRADDRFFPGFKQIADFRELSEILVTPEGVLQVAHINPFTRNSRRAVVVPNDLAFGLVRMFEALAEAEPDQFRIFRDMGPALEWVGLDPATPWPVEEPDAVIGATP